MDASDAMENIKGLIWNEVNHSPAVYALQRARPVQLVLFTHRENGAFSITLTMTHTIFLGTKYNLYRSEEFPMIT